LRDFLNWSMTYCNVGYTQNVRVRKVMIAIRLEKKRGNSHDCLFLGLVLQCFGRIFFFFHSSFLFVYLIVCFVYEHFTCTWGTQALLLHMYPCTHYKLSNWYQYSILCSRPKTPILEFECEYWYEIYECLLKQDRNINV